MLASSVVSETVYSGNAGADAPESRGWLLGHFKPEHDARHSDEVEVKWAIHPKGDQRSQWVAGEKRSALLLLVSGRFRVELPGRTVLLTEQGDYVVFHGVSHSWYAEEASVVVAVRWPSVPGYAANTSVAGLPRRRPSTAEAASRRTRLGQTHNPSERSLRPSSRCQAGLAACSLMERYGPSE